MTKHFMVIGILGAVVLWLEPNAVSATSVSLTERVQELKEQAREARLECDRFFARARRIEGGLSKREVFASRAIALAELSLAEEYPEFPKASSDILSFLNSLSDAQARDLDVGGLFASATGCDSVRYYGMLTRLINSAKVYRFSKADKVRLSGVVRGHLDADLAAKRTSLELELDFKLLKHAKQARLDLRSKPRVEALSGVAKLEHGMSVVGTPDRSPARRGIERSMLREVIGEVRRATELQNNLRKTLRGD